jgi:hypothetical protein
MGKVIHQGDAVQWLKERPILNGCSIVTSMPDVSEFPNLAVDAWKDWFRQTARLVLEKTPDDGLSVFYQTDILRDGEWIDKSYLIHDAAKAAGAKLLMHKIVCRTPPGETAFGKPGYSHLVVYSRKIRPEIAKSIPDVMPLAGESTWTRGMGLEACRVACRLIRQHTTNHTIVDPFCGHGSVLAVAEAMGFEAIGIELNAKRVRRARNLKVAAESVEL